MKFHFNYETLLEHRKLEEQIARRDFNEAAVRLDEQKALYKKLYTRLHEAETETFAIQEDPKGTSIAKLVELDDFISGQKIKIANQREVVINHTQIVEGKQEILIAAAKETMILEKLKEKQKLAFKKMVSKKEAKETDEIVTTRFKTWGSR